MISSSSESIFSILQHNKNQWTNYKFPSPCAWQIKTLIRIVLCSLWCHQGLWTVSPTFLPGDQWGHQLGGHESGHSGPGSWKQNPFIKTRFFEHLQYRLLAGTVFQSKLQQYNHFNWYYNYWDGHTGCYDQTVTGITTDRAITALSSRENIGKKWRTKRQMIDNERKGKFLEHLVLHSQSH